MIDLGATVVVIEHDLDVIRNADYIIDMGPGGGDAGGKVVAFGSPEDIAANRNSITGRFIKGCDDLTVFALDRIQKLDITDQSYAPKNLKDIKTRLNEVVGVNIDDDFDCETVVVRVYGKQRAYIDSLPLHFSQRVKDKTALLPS